MKNDLSCEVVQDLLPSYVDGLTSDVTKVAVEQHLGGCEACSEHLNGLRKILVPEEGRDEEWKKTVDAMAMNRAFRYMLFGVLAVLILFIAVWSFSSLSDHNRTLGFQVIPTGWDISVDEETGIILLNITLPNGRSFRDKAPSYNSISFGYGEHTPEEGGTLVIDIRCAYALGASGEQANIKVDDFAFIKEAADDYGVTIDSGTFSDYVGEIYIYGMDVPIWQAD